jgi:hypothetical protein
MHIIQSSSTRARRAAVAAALCLYPLLAACGGDEASETKGTAAADSASADTSAMALATRMLGPEVRMAIPFRIPHRPGRYVAAALPITEWVADVARSGSNAAPGGHELVILEVTAESHAVHKPGLYASRQPWLPILDDTATAAPADSATLSKAMGVEDADGDGNPEAWAAQYTAGGRAYAWEVRAYDRNGRTLYTATGSSDSDNEGCLAPASYAFAETVAQNPAMRAWLARKLEELNGGTVAAGGGAPACPSGAAGAAR